MSLKCFQRLSFLLILLTLTAPSLQLNWQGIGNMTQDNMTEIHTTITNNPISPAATDAQINTVAKTISLHLNSIWDPAWNVVIAKAQTGYDAIVYGYAFRKHWLWINGIFLSQDASTSFSLSYIIWKDYNCQYWYTMTDLTNLISTWTQDQLSVLNNYQATGSATDIWANAHTYVEYLNSHSLFNTGVYSAVMSGTSSCTFAFYVCMVDVNYLTQAPFGGLSEGSVFLFQTRIIQK